jgi:hypothetical protein
LVFDLQIVQGLLVQLIDVAPRRIGSFVRLARPCSHHLRPGRRYCAWQGHRSEAAFNLPADPRVVHIPTSALLFRQHGLKVATLGAGDKVVLRQVALGRNLGTEVKVLRGLTPADRIINSPPDSLADGDLVSVAQQGSPAKVAGARFPSS